MLTLKNIKKIIGIEGIKSLIIKEGIVHIDSGLDSTYGNEIFCDDCIVAPGFVDPQVNGYLDCNFWEEPTFKEIDELRIRLAETGTVAFFPTIITNKKEKILQSIELINKYLKQCAPDSGANIAGIHLEGIFISKFGVHKKEYATSELTIKNVNPFLKDNVSLFTIAPELDKKGDAIELLQKNNILVSIGHTDANYEEGNKAIDSYGLDTCTHIFNAMRGVEGFSHRKNDNPNIEILLKKLNSEDKIDKKTDGIILSILKHRDFLTMLIADGIHVNKETIKLLFNIKDKNKIALVSDLVAKDFFETEEKKGMLGGGQNTLEDCVRNLIDWKIVPEEDSLLCASYPITQKIKSISHLGKIQVGKKANLVIWDTKKRRVKGTIIGKNTFIRS